MLNLKEKLNSEEIRSQLHDAIASGVYAAKIVGIAPKTSNSGEEKFVVTLAIGDKMLKHEGFIEPRSAKKSTGEEIIINDLVNFINSFASLNGVESVADAADKVADAYDNGTALDQECYIRVERNQNYSNVRAFGPTEESVQAKTKVVVADNDNGDLDL